MTLLTRDKAIARLGQNTVVLRALLRGVSDKEAHHLRDVNADGSPGWNIVEVIGHLADFNGIFLGRIQRAQTEDNPVYELVDHEALVISGRYADRTLTEALDWFVDSRRTYIDYMATLPEAEWSRVGTHPEMGELITHEIAYNTVLHDILHFEQIAKILGAA